MANSEAVRLTGPQWQLLYDIAESAIKGARSLSVAELANNFKGNRGALARALLPLSHLAVECNGDSVEVLVVRPTLHDALSNSPAHSRLQRNSSLKNAAARFAVQLLREEIRLLSAARILFDNGTQPYQVF